MKKLRQTQEELYKNNLTSAHKKCQGHEKEDYGYVVDQNETKLNTMQDSGLNPDQKKETREKTDGI